MTFWESLHRLRLIWPVLALILLADAAGMAFGWYYYWDVGQFNPASVHYEHWAWWPLVADSPNAVLLFFVSILVYKLTGWRNQWLDASAFILNIYVGLWTSFLFLSYPDRMGTWDWGSTNNLLFFAHLGMPLQAFVLVHDLRRDHWPWQGTAAIIASAVVYIWVDYWGPHLHPAPFLSPDDAVLHAGSPWLMVAAVGAWALVAFLPTSRGPGRTTPP